MNLGIQDGFQSKVRQVSNTHSGKADSGLTHWSLYWWLCCVMDTVHQRISTGVLEGPIRGWKVAHVTATIVLRNAIFSVRRQSIGFSPLNSPPLRQHSPIIVRSCLLLRFVWRSSGRSCVGRLMCQKWTTLWHWRIRHPLHARSTFLRALRGCWQQPMSILDTGWGLVEIKDLFWERSWWKMVDCGPDIGVFSDNHGTEALDGNGRSS